MYTPRMLLQALVAASLHDDDVSVRRHAVLSLAALRSAGGPASAATVTDGLTRALTDPSPAIKRRAALALHGIDVGDHDGMAGIGAAGGGGGDAGITVLVGDLAHALQDPNRRVRRNAAQTLGSLGADAAGAAEALVDAGSDRSGSQVD